MTTGWYRIKKVHGGIFAISDHGWDTAYLVVGSRRAVLVDTTWGMSDLRSVVRSLARVPVTVVLTHGHADHVSGCYQFPKVHVSRRDARLLRGSYRPKRRQRFADSFARVLRSQGISPAKWGRARLGDVVTVTDGQTFDLGGRALRVVACPGHTAGSICLLDTQTGSLLTGDSLLEGDILVHLRDGPGLPVYLKSLRRLDRMSGAIRHLLPAHNRTPVSPALIRTLIDGVTEILAGKRKGRAWRDAVRRAVLGRAAVTFLSLLCGCGTPPPPLAAPTAIEPRPCEVSRTVAKGAIELGLCADSPTVAAGHEIRLRLRIANGTTQAVTFDNGSLVAYAIVRNAKGADIPQWQFFDVLAAPPGMEALWTVAPGASETRPLVLPFRDGTWSGFGIPGGTYRGYAVEARYAAGAAIHAIDAPPTTVSILAHWLADPEAVRSRAAKLGAPAPWSGDLRSNAVEIRLVR